MTAISQTLYRLLKTATILVICAVALMLTACAKSPDEGEPLSETSAEGTYNGFRETVLYYLSDDGFIVPIMKYIPWEEGIGKAALSYLVDTKANDSSASARGLNAVIPEGTEYTLRIADDGTATLDLINLSALEDSARESAMVAAVVNTLTEFPAINAVEIKINGRSGVTLPHGTVLDGAMSAFSLNAEEGALSASTGSGATLTLYFPNRSASLNIPVTRYVEEAATMENAVNELIEGPANGALLNCFPEGTRMLSLDVDQGLATLDLSAEFLGAAYTEGLDAAAYETLLLTLNEFEDVSALNITVEGEAYDIGVQTSAPRYANVYSE